MPYNVTLYVKDERDDRIVRKARARARGFRQSLSAFVVAILEREQTYNLGRTVETIRKQRGSNHENKRRPKV